MRVSDAKSSQEELDVSDYVRVYKAIDQRPLVRTYRMFCFDGTLHCLSVPACNPCEPAAVDSGLRRARLRKCLTSLASLSFSQRNT